MFVQNVKNAVFDNLKRKRLKAYAQTLLAMAELL